MPEPNDTPMIPNPGKPEAPPKQAPGQTPATDFPNKTPSNPTREDPKKIRAPRKEPGEPVPIK